MKLRIFPLLSLLVAVSLLVQGAPLPAAARTAPDPAALTAFSCDTVTEIPRAECEALVALYNSTNGPGWTHKAGWLVTNTPCGWDGIYCSVGHVLGVDLYNGNNLTGSIPSQLGNLPELTSLNLWGNRLSGSIPSELGNLSNLYVLGLFDNRLSGSIPPELGRLSNLAYLNLWRNRLSGAIPPQLGDLVKLIDLRLGNNALEGEIPSTLVSLTNLNAGVYYTDLGYNKLTASSPSVVAFLNAKDPDWAQTQTVPPTDLRASAKPVNSVEMTWTPIPYVGDAGYYEIGVSTAPGGPYSVHGRTDNKSAASYLVNNLLPDSSYYFAVRTYTPAHGYQQNNLLSGWSQEVFATTLSRIISHIEITQATQDQDNNVPLIAGKPTFVRIYLDCGEGCTEMPGVMGVLEVSGPAGGVSLNPISQPVTAYHPASWTTQRGDLGKTLNFAVPNQLMAAGQVTFTARAGASSLSETRTVQATNALRVAQIPIHYLACGYDTTPDMSAVTTVHSLAQNLLPVGGDTPIAVETWPKMYWSTPLKKDCNKPATVDNINEENVILLLRTIEAQWFIHGGSNPPDYVFGWLPAGAFDRGAAWPKPPALYGVAAFSDVFANEDPLAEFTWSKVTFAHELGHLMGHNGINTPDCPSDDPGVGWPWSDAKIHDWGVDSTYFGWSASSTSVLKNPQTTYDYMSYCGWKSSTASAWNLWTSAWTYTTTLRSLAANQMVVATSDSQPYFLVSGSVSVSDTAVLDPVWVITPTVTSALPPAGAGYCVEAQAGSGAVLSSHCFDLAFRLYETGAASSVDGFNLILPYPPGVARIVLRKGATELAVRPVSAHAPVVNVLSPNGGETWAASGTYTVTWSASDLDSDPLTYSVLYSPDGSNWVPIGTAVTTTQLAVNAPELAGGIAARVRVMATDGVNTSSDESDAAFTVGRKGPVAFILAPTGEVRFMPGTPLWLQGYGYDLEDGTLEGAALRWRSNRDGDLGTGSQALVTLSPGPHVVTLTATDKDDNTVMTSINVYAGGEIYLPLSLRTR
ncbi:MAG: fibronectin type III domain-containing protein [Chloroflexi bacterium]|nr:fibronectin type III domain-containing protein [Chloroflexota bacterium]